MPRETRVSFMVLFEIYFATIYVFIYVYVLDVELKSLPDGAINLVT